MKRFLITAVTFLCLTGMSFADSMNVGIIQGLWFSQDNYFVGDTIRIYTAVQNNSGADVEGIVEFFDNNVAIGSKNFSTLDKRIVEIWNDTVATKGKHQFSVRITELLKNKPGEAKEPISPRVIKSENIITVDIDTDKDGIGNKEDLDDDNDGFSDIDEKKAGTDLLDKTSAPKESEKKIESTPSSESSENLLDSILGILKGENEKKSNEPKPDDKPEELRALKDDKLVDKEPVVPESEVIKNLEEKYPFVQKVTKPVNNFQNLVVPSIIKEQERAQTKRTAADVTINPQDDGIDPLPPVKQKNEFGFWLWTIYGWILSLGQWLFSSLIGIMIVIFGGIYLLLKIIFKIFGSRTRIIS